MIPRWREDKHKSEWLSIVKVSDDFISDYPNVNLKWQFTDDAYKALKFETKESAELLSRLLTQGLGYYEGHKLTVTDHIFAY